MQEMAFRRECFLCLPFSCPPPSSQDKCCSEAVVQCHIPVWRFPLGCRKLYKSEPTNLLIFTMFEFFAKAFQLPLLNPYLEKNADFIHGVNFAVSGASATALNTNNSLSLQLGWFRTHLKSVCSSKAECKHRLGKTLFLLGEIEINDYAIALGEGRSLQHQAFYKLVPDVVRVIKDAVNEVINHGAAHVVVPGILIGCTPFNLLIHASNDTSKYDEFKCLKTMNDFAEFHNRKLQDAVKELQNQHPSVSISYGHLYSAFTWILQNAASLGFGKDGVFKACCGAGNNAYNCNTSRVCGSSEVLACQNPNKRVSWDGSHFTQLTNKYLAGWLPAHNIGAKAFHLPLLNPYLDKDANFSHGVNFAVAGSTALDTSVLAAKNITVLNTNSSLSVQLGWFRTHLESTCSSKAECKHTLGRTLFLLGATGANDYTYALLGGKSVQYLYKLVPDVVRVIKDAINEVIDQGAAHVVVPGFFHVGCTPYILVSFASNDTSKYDEFKCIKIINDFSEYHNRKLQDAVKELRHQHPSVSISYGDLYSAFIWLLQNAASLGFEKDGVLKTCCGVGNNAYNYDINRLCGTRVTACPDPKKRVSWDGLHLTHQAYKYMAGWLIKHNIGGG